ncbi:AAA family ATPase [Neobacillus drentensis]|uniref:AAA family ATPase n=1 Tax=Neobacillus drentensis TaxID=220684 RepID=UPI002FFF7766
MEKYELYRVMIERDPENAQAWFLLGEECLEQNQLAEALNAFSLSMKDHKMKNLVITSLRKYLLESEPETVLEPEPEPELELETELETELEPEPEPLPVQLKLIQGKVVSIEERLPKKVTFSNVGGLEELKKTIDMKIIKPFVNPGLFAKFRKKSGGGILLYGPPGCGKTFIAEATAGECGATFYPIQIADILDPYFGVSEQKLRDVFETARANRPAVLFFDEVDSLGYSRSKAHSEHTSTLVNTMLAEMQSIHTGMDKLLVIGATNMPWDVDAAFKRPGRFDKLVFVGPPDQEARKVIFKLKLAGKPVENGLDLNLLAEKTKHFSGADIENVVENAIENIIVEIIENGAERLLRMEDLLQIIENTKPTTVEWLNTIKNYIKFSNQSGLYNDAAKYLKENYL